MYLVEHLPTEQLRAAKIQKKTESLRKSEYHLLKRLHHPSLPRILDIYETEDEFWIIMEYVHGTPLTKDRKRMNDPQEFYRIAKQLTEAVIYLHTRSIPILHLDIKPPNIIRKPDGQIVLLDFGAAILKKADMAERQDLPCYGTLGFAAPEQISSDHKKKNRNSIDERADIYGIGATLYYCLTGTTARNDSIPKKGVAKWKQNAIRLIEKCVKKEPEQRIQSAQLLLQEIICLERFYQRRKHLSGIGGAAIVLIALVLFASWSFRKGGLTQIDSENKMEDIYAAYLEQASGLGEKNAVEVIRRAAQLYPERNWYLTFSERIFEDYSFTGEEERDLQSLLFETSLENGKNIQEEMKKDAVSYCRFSYQTGLAYWYYYEGSGGKSAAVKWFTECVETENIQNPKEKMMQASSAVYIKIGSYYETLGKIAADGTRQQNYARLWADLKELWEYSQKQELSETIIKELTKTQFSSVILGAQDLWETGESREQILNRLDELEKTICETQWSEDEKEVLIKEKRDAEAAVERAFACERESHEEKEE